MTGHVTHANLPSVDDAAANRLIASLDNPLAFGHPIKYLRLIETHISWIILTGDYAYKIKKPVDYGFLDFSTLEKRRFYCAEELRLNRRFAPEIYLELVEIRGSETAPRLHGSGEVIEYAIKMLEFPQQCLLSAHAANHDLNDDLINAIATTIAAMHAASDRADPASDFGAATVAAKWSEENMVHIAQAIGTEFLPNSYFQLTRWYQENNSLLTSIDARKQDGFVRECHGDLHLGNMALINDRVTLFDCIEFNPQLRWIDTISEVAFVAMDLQARGYAEYCWRFINQYLAISADYAAVKLLRYYFIYRALVRAKVEALRIEQQDRDTKTCPSLLKPALDYIELARLWADSHRAGMIIMHGLSGSGKSTIAAKLVEALGAIQIRSDVVRKHLFDLDAASQTDAALDQGIYTEDATELTYRRLKQIAQTIIDADFTVILDATFLQQSRRRQMLETQTGTACKRIIINCAAPVEKLRKRIIEREDDPSEANLAVLEKQLLTRQPINAEDEAFAQVVNISSDGISPEQIRQIRKLLAS
jgi:aminoglycoside phosphotransferase family enzyme/predicted kinase